jgi:hypothetical protein
MATIPKTKVYNPKKAEAYVGKGVLKNGGKISCWTGYVKKGTKKKGGKTVNNCVKKK